jgi:predicted enzyme related to lactoylglutathione lyase
MSNGTPQPPGTIVWTDLTVPDAERLRDFYSHVVGWEPSQVSMGQYNDYQMNLPGTTQGVAGVCHARGVNAGLPPQWLVYIVVADMDHALKECKARGGSVVVQPRAMGAYGSYCVIRDPAGAVCALLQPRAQP